jgi:hypothetical protein
MGHGRHLNICPLVSACVWLAVVSKSLSSVLSHPSAQADMVQGCKSSWVSNTWAGDFVVNDLTGVLCWEKQASIQFKYSFSSLSSTAWAWWSNMTSSNLNPNLNSFQRISWHVLYGKTTPPNDSAHSCQKNIIPLLSRDNVTPASLRQLSSSSCIFMCCQKLFISFCFGTGSSLYIISCTNVGLR